MWKTLIPSNVSEADFVRWNQEREQYLQANAELALENVELRGRIKLLEESLDSYRKMYNLSGN